ncbi:MAG: spore germination protein [Clostridia bacterium]|nr:spore germination protein [Clostridia bacterium]
MFKFTKKKHKDSNKYSSDESIELIDSDLHKNINRIKQELGDSSDLIVNFYKVSEADKLQHAILYIEELADKASLNSLSLEYAEFIKSPEINTPDKYYYKLKNSITGFRNTQEDTKLDSLFEYLLSGYSIFLVDGCKSFFAINTYSPEGRAIDEPTTQTVIRGPKDGFTEKMSTNIALVRKRIQNKSLRLYKLTLGKVSKTKAAVMYIDKIAKDEIVSEIIKRISRISTDSILSSANIEELIKDDRYSVFPTIINYEKPDSVAAALLEGRIAVFVDGTPFVIVAPALFFEFIQASEDYYNHYLISSMIRIIRYTSFFLTFLVPAVYIALVTFHQEMIPTVLLINIAAQREGIPFPALVEAFLMEITFEILREAGIRMPRAIGPAISIVGALVLGQAAVEAGIVSAAMVIVVAITAIASFTIPNYSMANAIRISRFALMLLAGSFGFYGVFMGLIVLTLHLCKLKSIGIPYLTPLAPFNKTDNKDTLLRFPLWKMTSRPTSISGSDKPRVRGTTTVSQGFKEKPEKE